MAVTILINNVAVTLLSVELFPMVCHMIIDHMMYFFII
jgi:hypothetical protein